MIGKQEDKIKRIRKRTDDNNNRIKQREDKKKEKIKTIIRTQYKQVKKRGTNNQKKNIKTASKLGHYFSSLKIVMSLPRRLRLFAESRKRHGSETTISKA